MLRNMGSPQPKIQKTKRVITEVKSPSISSKTRKKSYTSFTGVSTTSTYKPKKIEHNKTQSSFYSKKPTLSVNSYGITTLSTNLQARLASSDRKYRNLATSPNKSHRSLLSFGEKLHTLESFITNIKENTLGKEDHVEKIKRKKQTLANKVDILVSNIKSIKKEDKVNYSLLKNIDKENSRLQFNKEKAYYDSFYIQKELPKAKEEVERMKKKICELNESTTMLRNEYLSLEKEMLLLKDGIKTKNGQILLVNKEREKIKNEIVIADKHNQAIADKIVKYEKASEEFMANVEMLYKNTKQ